MSEADETLRAVSRHFPEALVRALTRPTATVRDAQWIETQLTRRARRLDRALRAEVDGVAEVHHVEWAWRWSKRIPYRMFEYHTMLAMAQHEHPTEPPLPIRSAVVLLSGRQKPWGTHGEYRTSPLNARFAGVPFRIDAVYQQRITKLRARGSELWLAFAPLCLDADVRSLTRVAHELRERVRDETRLGELAAAMGVFAQLDGRERGLAPDVEAMFPREITMKNFVYTRGKEDGIHETLLHQATRRLGRVPSAAEHAALMRLLATREGAERLGDAVLDLDATAFAAWIVAP